MTVQSLEEKWSELFHDCDISNEENKTEDDGETDESGGEVIK